MKSSCLKQQIYDDIKKSIIRCEYAPGLQLNEDAFCQRFGVSRTPVRDALGRLEQEGLVRILSKRGVLINPVSLNSVNELFEVRLRIEPYAVFTYGNRLNEETYAAFFRRFCDEPKDMEAVYQLDSEFHYSFIEVSNNRYLNMIYRITADQSERCRILTAAGERLDYSQKEHLDIASACLRRDWGRASELMRMHINKSRDSIIDYVLNQEKSSSNIYES